MAYPLITHYKHVDFIDVQKLDGCVCVDYFIHHPEKKGCLQFAGKIVLQTPRIDEVYVQFIGHDKKHSWIEQLSKRVRMMESNCTMIITTTFDAVTGKRMVFISCFCNLDK